MLWSRGCSSGIVLSGRSCRGVAAFRFGGCGGNVAPRRRGGRSANGTRGSSSAHVRPSYTRGRGALVGGGAAAPCSITAACAAAGQLGVDGAIQGKADAAGGVCARGAVAGSSSSSSSLSCVSTPTSRLLGGASSRTRCFSDRGGCRDSLWLNRRGDGLRRRSLSAYIPLSSSSSLVSSAGSPDVSLGKSARALDVLLVWPSLAGPRLWGDGVMPEPTCDRGVERAETPNSPSSAATAASARDMCGMLDGVDGASDRGADAPDSSAESARWSRDAS